jgi:hypothetical protein
LNKSGGATAIAGNLVIGDGSGSDVVQFLQNNQIADTSSVTVNTGGTFDLVGATDTIGALSMAFDATVGLGSGIAHGGRGRAANLRRNDFRDWDADACRQCIVASFQCGDRGNFLASQSRRGNADLRCEEWDGGV